MQSSDEIYGSDKMRAVIAVFLMAALAACAQEQKADESSAPVVSELHMPAWATEYTGRRLSEVFPNQNTDCAGNADRAEIRGARAVISGWAWDRAAGRPYDRLISVGADGTINGAGATTRDRPDVVSGRNGEVTNPRVGFEVISTAASGHQRVAALDLDTNSACWVGIIDY